MKPNLYKIPQRLQSATCWLMIVAMLTFNPLRVQAQPLVSENVALTPVSSGTNSSFTTAEETVIRDPATYANFFQRATGGPPPVTPGINFAAQDVLAVTMGTQPTGSSISITGVTIDTTGFTAGWAHVYISQIVGSGGTIPSPVTITGGTITNTGGQSTMANSTLAITGGTITITSTTTSQGGTVVTITAVGATTTIYGGTLTTTGGTTNAVSGATNDTNTGGTTTTTGGTTTTTSTVTATGGSFSILSGSISTTPTGTVITNGSVDVIGGNVSTSGTTTTGGTTTISGGTTVANGNGTCHPYAVVAVPKGALFYDFINNVTPVRFGGSVLPFSLLRHVVGNATTPYIETDTIDRAGNVTINKSRGTTGGTTITGRLQPGEMQTLGSAYQTTNFANLPSTVTDPSAPKSPILPTETFTSVANGVTQTATFEDAGFFEDDFDEDTPGPVTPEVEEPGSMVLLEDAIRGPVERIERGVEGFELAGAVNLSGITLTVASQLINPDDPVYDLLAEWNRKDVELEAETGPSGISVLSVGTHLIAPANLLSFPSAGGTVIASLPLGASVRITDFTLFGNYYEVTADEGEQRGFVPASAIVVGPSAAGQAKIEDLLFVQYLQYGGLLFNGGPASGVTGAGFQEWFSPNNPGTAAPDPTDPWARNSQDSDHAVNTVTGQNAVYDHANQQWVDAATGQALSPSGNNPALLEDQLFVQDLQYGGLLFNGGPASGVTGAGFQEWFSPNNPGTAAPDPTDPWARNSQDSDHAVNTVTGQNAVYDHQNVQWVDAQTGQPLSQSLK